MARTRIEDIQVTLCAHSYSASAHAAAVAAGMYAGDFGRFMGETGLAFFFAMSDHGAQVVAPTAFDWHADPFAALDRIGIRSSFTPKCASTANSFRSAQRDAVARIRACLDRGAPVVVWSPTPIPEFGLIHGYDDDDGVFFVRVVAGHPRPDPLLYENLGKGLVPFLYAQFLEERTGIDPELAWRTSLECAGREWQSPRVGEEGIARGKAAYESLLRCFAPDAALQAQGMCYALLVFSELKGYAADHVARAAREAGEIGSLTPAARAYAETARLWKELHKLAPFRVRDSRLDPAHLPAMRELASAAYRAESTAVDELSAALELDVG